MAMHFDVVDVFLVQESNFTNSGKERALGLLKKVKGGWLEDYQEKLVYLQRTEMPPGGFEDGKEADADMRRQLSWRGLERLENIQPSFFVPCFDLNFSRLENLQPDDLFLYTDSDELPRPEVLTKRLDQHHSVHVGAPVPQAL